MRTIAALSLLTFSACAAHDHVVARHPLLRLEQHRQGERTQLSIVALDGARINARLPPVLEAHDTIVRFGSAMLTEDSAYFVNAPRAYLDTGRVVRGLLRVSACPPKQQVCLTVQLPVNGGP